VQVDQTAVNVARAEIEAFDFALDYSKQTERFGRFDLFGVATRQVHFKTQLIPDAPVVENVGISDNSQGAIVGVRNPLAFKGNAGIAWSYRGWDVGWTANYFASYRVTNPTQILNQGNGGHVPSQIYHDIVGTYRFDGASSWLEGMQVQVGVKNVFNTRPPFDASYASFYSPYGDPRLATYYVSLKKAFGL
jgi:outer membrane receptor protein involved in Fe transport